MSNPIISSFVYHAGKCWNVSTIYRECSAIFEGDKYYKTLVWEYANKTRGKLVYQDEGFEAHFIICKNIISNGAFWET